MMRRAQRFFRCVWRINGVLILIAAGAAIVGVGSLMIQELGYERARNRAADGIAIAEPNAESDLVLSRASLVEGTQVMRAELQRFPGEVKFSSGASSETRNILFIEPGQKAAHWLLPDNEHIVTDSSDIKAKPGSTDDPVVVTAALVKLATESPDRATGKLLLFDPPGRKIVEVADGVRTIQVASIKAGELSILYERNKRLYLDVFDPLSLAKLREQEIEVPQLK